MVKNTPQARTPRAQKRHPIPLGAGSISAELRVRGEPVHHGQLWDLSRTGACLLARGALELLHAAGHELELVLRPSFGVAEAVTIPVATRWCQPEGHQTFIGLQFASRALPDNSFLLDFLEESWAA